MYHFPNYGTYDEEEGYLCTDSEVHSENYAELAVSSQWWPKPSPVLIAPTHGGLARLSLP